ncbi:hypothetical protein KR032_007823 [Drosophila birchii]|nr:hypothetical protein KR032_007823 [Drosophila birchii]
MWPALRQPIRKVSRPLIRQGHGYAGNEPGNNLPFGLNSPIRFTLWFTIWGAAGFGSPFLVIRHQMLRNVTDDDPQ